MVLCKRKPVQYAHRPPLHDDQEIWVIKETDEIFTNYDNYLGRMDYYKQKRFICEITGHSGLDFFSALKNEVEASNEVDDSFPDALREPILRKVQHSTISRIDSLVDSVFEEFKQDFYPGESVIVVLEGHDKMNGVVREKSRFPEIRKFDGTVERKSFARYFVSLPNQPDHEAIVDHEHIVRERKIFTKQILRSYLKNSLHRESWSGAPWQVKERLACEYRINTQIPDHLRYQNQIAQRKFQMGVKKGEYDGTLLSFFPKVSLSELKPIGMKKKSSSQDLANVHKEHFLEYQKALSRNPNFGGLSLSPSNTDDLQFIQFINQNPNFPAVVAKGLVKPPATPAIKYPREDLELDLSATRRPPLKFMSPTSSAPGRPSIGTELSHSTEWAGPLLETWNTLNVYCEVFLLDSFTFDDYVDALQAGADGAHCELISEIHCAVMKTLVNGENDQNGRVHINLPAAQESDDDSSETSTPAHTPSPEPEVQKRTTRGSLAKSEAAELRIQAALDAKLHNGPEIDQCIRGYGWKARLRKRDFANGRWLVALVGLLNLYSNSPLKKQMCDELLALLAPVNMKAAEETVISQYSQLDAIARVRIIQFLCMLSLDTPSVRSYMEECTVSMTQFRKEKMEWQRKRKTYLEELKALDEERRAFQPEADLPAVELEGLEEEIEEEDSKLAEDDGDVAMESEDQEVIPQRSLRRANDRAAERKRKMEDERKRKEKAEVERANKPSKEARQLEKILKKVDIVKDNIKECETEVAMCDNDLRESDCHRTRVLGKDRFWNRYYWYERNAMPYAGLPDSSTANAGYANGRVWVQGPEESERVGFIDIAEAEQARYKSAFTVDVSERKIREEGLTHTFTATDWGYYDDHESLDKLIGWLNEKGQREIKLRKELQAQREQITIHMEKRRQYLESTSSKRSESADAAPRISMRTKTQVDSGSRRFLSWRNTTAMREIGHLHADMPKGLRRGVARAVSGPKKAAIEEEARQTRASSRQGKPPGRQGTRYKF